MKATCNFNRLTDGSYTLRICVKKIRPGRSRSGRKYTIVNINQFLDRPIELDGVKLKPQLILKLVRKISERSVVAMKRRRQKSIPLPDEMLL